jgi:hypothetical protein
MLKKVNLIKMFKDIRYESWLDIINNSGVFLILFDSNLNIVYLSNESEKFLKKEKNVNEKKLHHFFNKDQLDKIEQSLLSVREKAIVNFFNDSTYYWSLLLLNKKNLFVLIRKPKDQLIKNEPNLSEIMNIFPGNL